MSIDQQIRVAVVERMRERRLTQQALADKLGIKQPSVAAVISGKRGHIPQSLIDLLDALDLELCIRPRRG